MILCFTRWPLVVSMIAVEMPVSVPANPRAGAVPTDPPATQCDAADGRERPREGSDGTFTGCIEDQCRLASHYDGCLY